jgi:DNA polymerase
MFRVVLDHPADFEGLRLALKSAVAKGVPPHRIDWCVAGAEPLALNDPLPLDAALPPLRVPRRFAELAELAVCHRDPGRFLLIHEGLLRLLEGRARIDDGIDAILGGIASLAQAVSRDRDRMRAVVRFRDMMDGEGPNAVAWFEPAHHVVRLNSGFFLRRFAMRRWTILTPDESVHWDGAALHWLPGAAQAEASVDDPLDAVWMTYRATILDPARRKLKAVRPPTLAALAEAARACTRCPLHGPATRTVFGEGPADSRLMIVGEQPGDQEDRLGRPFVGPAGQLLDQCLAEAGIDRARTYVTNAVKHFKFTPRGPRRLHATPGPAEIAACRLWLDQEIALLNPALILMLGASAARSFLGRPVAVGRERGRPIPLADGRSGFLTVHPSYLLRIDNPEAQAAERARFVADLRAAAALAQAGA